MLLCTLLSSIESCRERARILCKPGLSSRQYNKPMLKLGLRVLLCTYIISAFSGAISSRAGAILDVFDSLPIKLPWELIIGSSCRYRAVSARVCSARSACWRRYSILRSSLALTVLSSVEYLDTRYPTTSSINAPPTDPPTIYGVLLVFLALFVPLVSPLVPPATVGRVDG